MAAYAREQKLAPVSAAVYLAPQARARWAADARQHCYNRRDGWANFDEVMRRAIRNEQQIYFERLSD